MRGLPWEPMPGKHSMHIPVDVDDNGDDPEGDRGREFRPIEALDDDVPVELRGSTDKFHTSRKAITKYGMTAGCPGCGELARRGARPGKITYHHSDECRRRVIDHMKGDPEYRRLMERHGLAIGMIQSEAITQEQARENKHEVEKAIAEIEKKERANQWRVKEGQFNSMMKLMFERMEVAEVYSPPRIVQGTRNGIESWLEL